MLLWVIFAALTAAAVLLVAAPLARGRVDVAPGPAHDIAVYKAQLKEIGTDLERGTLTQAEAEAARIEVSRRILKEEERAAAQQTDAASGRTGLALPSIIVAIPVLTVAGYLVLGSPTLPGQPMSVRLEQQAEDQDIAVLVRRVETHLADNPEDGRGWAVLAPVYRQMGRFDDAARAYANVIRLLGSSADRQGDYGEMLVAADDGVIKDRARAAFEAALTHDARAIKPRFFLAMAAEQDGDRDLAIARWTELLEGSEDPDGRWRVSARQHLADLGVETGAPAAETPGPDADQVAAAAEMTAEDRQAMIEGMVAGLAERLADGGGSVEEWLRLIRAYDVLGRPEDRAKAIEQARTQFAGDAAALERIDAVANAAQN